MIQLISVHHIYSICEANQKKAEAAQHISSQHLLNKLYSQLTYLSPLHNAYFQTENVKVSFINDQTNKHLSLTFNGPYTMLKHQQKLGYIVESFPGHKELNHEGHQTCYLSEQLVRTTFCLAVRSKSGSKSRMFISISISIYTTTKETPLSLSLQ